MTTAQLEVAGDRTFSLLTDLVYKGKYDTYVVPAGFVTDLATVPRFLTWLLPTYGRYTIAAIIHDYLCTELERVYADPKSYRIGTENHENTTHSAPANSVDVDGIFRRVMRESGVPTFRRWLLWTGVRWGALFSRKGRRPGSLSTLLPVLLVSILALPLVLIPTLFVLAGLAVDKIVELL